VPPVATTFDVRAWLARQLRVARDELVLLGTPLPGDWSTRAVMRYAYRSADTVQLTVSGLRAHVRTGLPSDRRVTARWPGGSASTHIVPGVAIEW
jgi:hypothetical protein